MDSDEEIFELSRKMDLPRSYVQTLPFSQLTSLISLVKNPPNTFLETAAAVELTHLSNVLHSEGLRCLKNIPYRALRDALVAAGCVSPPDTASPLHFRKLLTALSKYPETQHVNLQLYLALHKVWRAVGLQERFGGSSASAERTASNVDEDVVAVQLERPDMIFVFDLMLSRLLPSFLHTAHTGGHPHVVSKSFFERGLREANIFLSSPDYAVFFDLLRRRNIIISSGDGDECVDMTRLEELSKKLCTKHDLKIAHPGSDIDGHSFNQAMSRMVKRQVLAVWLRARSTLASRGDAVAGISPAVFAESLALSGVHLSSALVDNMWYFFLTELGLPAVRGAVPAPMISLHELDEYLLSASRGVGGDFEVAEMSMVNEQSSMSAIMRDVPPRRLRKEHRQASTTTSLSLEWSTTAAPLSSHTPAPTYLQSGASSILPTGGAGKPALAVPWQYAEASAAANVTTHICSRLETLDDDSFELFVNTLEKGSRESAARGSLSRSILSQALAAVGVRISGAEVDEFWREASWAGSALVTSAFFDCLSPVVAARYSSIMKGIADGTQPTVASTAATGARMEQTLPPPLLTAQSSATMAYPTSLNDAPLSPVTLMSQPVPRSAGVAPVVVDNNIFHTPSPTCRDDGADEASGHVLSPHTQRQQSTPFIRSVASEQAVPRLRKAVALSPRSSHDSIGWAPSSTERREAEVSSCHSSRSGGTATGGEEEILVASITPVTAQDVAADKKVAIEALQRRRAALAVVFRKLQGVHRHTSSSVPCKDLAQALLVAPLSIPGLPANAAWELVCDMASISYSSDPDTASIQFVDVIRFIDSSENATATPQCRPRPVSIEVGGDAFVVSNAVGPLLLRQSIKKKLADSSVVRGDRLRLLSQAPQLRQRLKNIVGRTQTASWEGAPDHLTLHELIKLFESLDLRLSMEEAKFLRQEIHGDATKAGYDDPALEQGVQLSALLLFLSTMIQKS